MVNEHRKVSNLNVVICRVYVTKNSWTKDKGNLDPPSILVISPSKPWNFPGDGLIYERRAWWHKENILKFLPGHGEAIPWHHAMRHVFQAFISFFVELLPSKRRIYGWLLPHISTKYLSIPCKWHENLLNGTRVVFQSILVHLFMHQLFEFELCALMPRECK